VKPGLSWVWPFESQESEKAVNKSKMIEAAAACLAPLADSRPTISFTFIEAAPDEQNVFETIVGMGGTARATLYEEEGREPYVIESVELELEGVKVFCQFSRPAKASDRKRGESREHRKAFVATAVGGVST